MDRVFTDVRVERFDLSVWDLPGALPGLVKINFDPPASGPEWELTFVTAEGATPPSEDFLRSEIERITRRSVLAIRRHESMFPMPELDPKLEHGLVEDFAGLGIKSGRWWAFPLGLVLLVLIAIIVLCGVAVLIGELA